MRDWEGLWDSNFVLSAAQGRTQHPTLGQNNTTLKYNTNTLDYPQQ
jgi:hypothetical protein